MRLLVNPAIVHRLEIEAWKDYETFLKSKVGPELKSMKSFSWTLSAPCCLISFLSFFPQAFI